MLHRIDDAFRRCWARYLFKGTANAAICPYRVALRRYLSDYHHVMELTERNPYSWRADASVPTVDHDGPMTVMDATCGLCARGATWIARSDSVREFRIIPMQSARGRALFQHFGLDPDDPASWLFLENGRAYTSFDGIIRAGWRLGGLSRALVVLRVLPRPILDWLYARIARNRFAIMGSADLCSLPDPAVQTRLMP